MARTGSAQAFATVFRRDAGGVCGTSGSGGAEGSYQPELCALDACIEQPVDTRWLSPRRGASREETCPYPVAGFDFLGVRMGGGVVRPAWGGNCVSRPSQAPQVNSAV